MHCCMVQHQLHQPGPQVMPGMVPIRMHTNQHQPTIIMMMDNTIPTIMAHTMIIRQMTSVDLVATSMIQIYHLPIKMFASPESLRLFADICSSQNLFVFVFRFWFVCVFRYPAGVNPAACPNYPYCDNGHAAAYHGAPAAAPLPGYHSRQYPAGLSAASCPNYPYCY